MEQGEARRRHLIQRTAELVKLLDAQNKYDGTSLSIDCSSATSASDTNNDTPPAATPGPIAAATAACQLPQTLFLKLLNEKYQTSTEDEPCDAVKEYVAVLNMEEGSLALPDKLASLQCLYDRLNCAQSLRYSDLVANLVRNNSEAASNCAPVGGDARPKSCEDIAVLMSTASRPIINFNDFTCPQKAFHCDDNLKKVLPNFR